MIVAIVGKLEGLRAKVEEALAHVKAGVEHLNEDQQAVTAKLVQEIEMEAAKVRIEVHGILGTVEAKIESMFSSESPNTSTRISTDGVAPLPSAEDLDAVAAEQQAADETK